MRELLRPMLPMIVVLAVPIVPFLIFGQERMERALNEWREHPPPPMIVAGAVVGLLATDIFLPIPSSLVSTLAGWQLGAVGGTAASWIGMSLGAAIGFALARQLVECGGQDAASRSQGRKEGLAQGSEDPGREVKAKRIGHAEVHGSRGACLRFSRASRLVCFIAGPCRCPP